MGRLKTEEKTGSNEARGNDHHLPQRPSDLTSGEWDRLRARKEEMAALIEKEVAALLRRCSKPSLRRSGDATSAQKRDARSDERN